MSEEISFTDISVIYDIFLSKVSSYTLSSDDITAEEIDEELFGYFDSARTLFYKCKNSLETNEEKTVILSVLTPFEKAIIVKLMRVEYLAPKVLSDEVILQSLSDKDFKIHSQANQLRELSLLYGRLKKEADKMITEYTYIGMTDK